MLGMLITSDGDALALHAVDEADGVVGVADGAEHVLAAAANPAAADGLLRHDAGLHPSLGGGVHQLPAAVAAAGDELPLPLRGGGGGAAHADLDGGLPALVGRVQELLQRGAAALEGRGVRGGPAPAADPDEELLHDVPRLHRLAAPGPPLLRPRPARDALDRHHTCLPPPALHGHAQLTSRAGRRDERSASWAARAVDLWMWRALSRHAALPPTQRNAAQRNLEEQLDQLMQIPRPF